MKQYHAPEMKRLTLDSDMDVITASSASSKKLTLLASGDGNNWFVSNPNAD